MRGAYAGKDKAYEIGDHFETDDPPGVGDVHFGVGVGGDASDFLFGEFR